MKKIYISADLEGVNGVVYPHQVLPEGGRGYLNAVEQQLFELKTVIETLKANKVGKITVNDAHGTMENIAAKDISQNVNLISGKPKLFSMMHGLDHSYDGAILLGYHAAAGTTDAALAHTFSFIFNEIKLNSRPIGEIELNSIYAGLFEVPIIIISGDNKACQQAKAFIKTAETVCVKESVSYSSANCKSNIEIKETYKNAIKSALAKPRFFDIPKAEAENTLEIEFKEIKHAETLSLLSGIGNLSQTGQRTFKFEKMRFEEVYRIIQFLSATLI